MRISRKLTQAAILIGALLPLSAAATRNLSRRGQRQTPSKRPAANCEISGVVTDAGTGRPLAGAQVMVLNFQYKGIAGAIPVPISGSPCDHCDVYGTLRYQAITNARGRFTIRKIVPGQYLVRALARGYAAEYYHVSERYAIRNGFFLQSGQKRDDIRIELPRQAVLTGRVIDENGQPVISAYVEVMQYEPFGVKQKTLQLLTATVTDDRGIYRIFGLSPGRYYIEARYEPGLDLSAFSPRDVAERFLRRRDNPDAFSPQFYYPGVTELNKAKPIDVSAGQVKSGLDISVHPSASAENANLYPGRFVHPPPGDCQISGVVTDAATGRPLDHAWVFLYPAFGAMRPPLFSMTSTGANGRFDFRGISCVTMFPLMAWKDGFVDTFHSPVGHFYPPGTVNPSPTQPKITHVNFSLVPAGVITGKITDAHGKPAPCVRVVLLSQSSLRNRGLASPTEETVTDDRGRYRFYQLAAGRYYVAAQIQPSNSVATQTTATLPVTATASSRAAFASPYVYYPGAANVASAKEIRVVPGEQGSEIDFSVKP